VKMPEYIDVKIKKVSDGGLVCDVSLRYIPLKVFLKAMMKAIGWKIWLYPVVVIYCLENLCISPDIFDKGINV
jgi:hypothetical protein